MNLIHRYAGIALIACFLLVALWGAVAWFSNRHPGKWFWRLLAFGQVGVGVQALVGIALFVFGGRRPFLHYAYGLFPVLVLGFAHRAAKRLPGLEWGAFSFAGLVIFGLLLRGFMTGLAP